MSAIAGIHGFGGRPADPDALALMTMAMARRGPDGEGRWVEGSIGLGHRLLHSTPESLGEKQPVSDDRGECRLVWDGRLDNRGELIAALEGAPGGRDRTDPEIVLEAYRRWGEPFLSRIVGDFALAIWDGRAGRLLCARDPLGVKPLCYHVRAHQFSFGSQIAAIVSDHSVGVSPDDGMITDFLLMDFRDPGATFFKGIRQLPPGHLLALDDAGLTLRRYWDADESRRLRLAGDEAYLEAFSEAFREAVRCRLRSHAPVAVLLSGGIDSTSVTAMAESIRRAEPGHPRLLGFTLLWDEFLAEERDAIEALTRACGTPVHTLEPEAGGRRLTRFELGLEHSEALHHESFLTVPLMTRPMAERGCRTLLTGFGADELIGSGETGYVVGLLRSLRPVAFCREVRRMARAYALDGFGSAVSAAWSQAPSAFKRAVKTAAGRSVPRWLDPDFARRARVAERTPPAPRRKFPTLCQEWSYRAVTSPSLALALTWMDSTASTAALECRHPFLDRRLIEIFLSIPSTAKVSRGYRKMFLQEALRPLPAAPARPIESSEVAVGSMDRETWVRTDAERLREILFRPGALVFDYVERREAERIRDRYLGGEQRCRNLLWQFAKLELWLREFAEGRP